MPRNGGLIVLGHTEDMNVTIWKGWRVEMVISTEGALVLTVEQDSKSEDFDNPFVDIMVDKDLKVHWG